MTCCMLLCCAGYTDLGCYGFNITRHPGSVDLTSTHASKMTPAMCFRLSSAYDFFGLVNGSRCVGFTSLQAAISAACSETSWGGGVKSYKCLVPCAGAANATCGSLSTMQLYAHNKPVPQLAPVPGERQGGGGWTSSDTGGALPEMQALLIEPQPCRRFAALSYQPTSHQNGLMVVCIVLLSHTNSHSIITNSRHPQPCYLSREALRWHAAVLRCCHVCL